MRKLLLTCSLVALLAAPLAFAQPGGGRGFTMGGLMLLNNKGVQEELKLTDEQKEKIAEVAKQAFTEAGKGFKEKDLEAARKAMDEGFKTASKELKSEQKKRLDEIEIQAAGLEAFAKENVQKALKLTDKQKDEIKEITDEVRKDAEEVMKDARGDKEKRAEAIKKVTKLRTSAIDKVTKTFSDDQKTAWKELTGKPFEIKFEGFTRPGKGKDKTDK